MKKIIKYFPLNKGIVEEEIKTLIKPIAIYLGTAVVILTIANITDWIPIVKNLTFNISNIYGYYILAGIGLACYQYFMGKDYSDEEFITLSDIAVLWNSSKGKIILGVVLVALCLIPHKSAAKIEKADVIVEETSAEIEGLNKKDKELSVKNEKLSENIEESDEEMQEYSAVADTEEQIEENIAEANTELNADVNDSEMLENMETPVDGESLQEEPKDIDLLAGRRLDEDATPWQNMEITIGGYHIVLGKTKLSEAFEYFKTAPEWEMVINDDGSVYCFDNAATSELLFLNNLTAEEYGLDVVNYVRLENGNRKDSVVKASQPPTQIILPGGITENSTTDELVEVYGRDFELDRDEEMHGRIDTYGYNESSRYCVFSFAGERDAYGMIEEQKLYRIVMYDHFYYVKDSTIYADMYRNYFKD